MKPVNASRREKGKSNASDKQTNNPSGFHWRRPSRGRRIMDKHLEAIEEIEEFEVEKIFIQDTKLKRCCTASLELVKAVLEYLKLKHPRINE